MAKKQIGLMAAFILIGSMVMACGPAMPVHEDGGSTASAGRPNGAEPTIRRISTHSMQVPLSALVPSTAMRNDKISVELQLLLMEFTNDLAEGKTDELETVSVQLRVDRQIDEVTKYLEDRSIVLSKYVESTSPEKDGTIHAVIPFMLVEDLAALPNVLVVTAPEHFYQNVVSQLHEAFAYYKGGFKSAEEAAKHFTVHGDDTVHTKIRFQERTYLEDMETFLAGHGVEPEAVHLGTRQGSVAPFHVVAHVPISLLGTIAHRPGVFEVVRVPVPDPGELPPGREAIFPKHSRPS